MSETMMMQEEPDQIATKRTKLWQADDDSEGLAGVDSLIQRQETLVKPKPRITKQMIKAGAARLIELDNGTNHQELAREIYAAMWAVRDE